MMHEICSCYIFDQLKKMMRTNIANYLDMTVIPVVGTHAGGS